MVRTATGNGAIFAQATSDSDSLLQGGTSSILPHPSATSADSSGTQAAFASQVTGAALASAAHAQAAASAGLTPTVSEFLNGAISEYVIGGVPGGMKPFVVNGKQMSFHNDATGAVAHAWVTAENQVLVTFAGTTRGENILIDPLASVGGLLSDLGILQQKVSPAQTEALGFARQVISEAAKQGYAQSQIFVTGHSLGGIEAEYVAQQTGLGGIGFEPTGIKADPTAAGNGSNFVNVVTQGDPVANYSSDIAGEQPFAPTFVSSAQGGGILPHYGSVLQIGSAADQQALSSVAGLVGHAFSGDTGSFDPLGALLHPVSVAAGLAAAVPLIVNFHFPAAEYKDLGVTPTGGFLDKLPSYIGAAHGAVLPLGNDTIPQVQAYITSHSGVGV